MSKNVLTIRNLVIGEVKRLNGKFPSKKELEDLVKTHFPNSKWKDTHHAWYKSQIKTGKISINDLDADIIEEIDEDNLKEVSLSLEKDLHAYLSLRLEELESGLELVENGIEYKTDAGFIDLLAIDVEGNYVVIELKAGKAKDAVIGQILGYIGALSKEKSTDKVRGIIVASEFENRLLYASKGINNLKLIKYGFMFSFTEEELL